MWIQETLLWASWDFSFSSKFPRCYAWTVENYLFPNNHLKVKEKNLVNGYLPLTPTHHCTWTWWQPHQLCLDGRNSCHQKRGGLQEKHSQMTGNTEKGIILQFKTGFLLKISRPVIWIMPLMRWRVLRR